jgi:SAM-dependent methyltransferase
MFNFLKAKRLASKNIFQKYYCFSEFKEEWREKEDCHNLERLIIKKQKETALEAYCAYCKKTTKMKIDFLYARKQADGILIPNFRERIVCPKCNLNNRLRATYHLLENIEPNLKNKQVYITEAVTPLFELFKDKVKLLVGSEYFPENDATKVFISHVGREVNNEDLTNISFENDQFDFVISLEVLEHIPNYKQALKEIFRILKKNGNFILSIPFILNSQKNIVRARVNDGAIEHLLPAEYHGDPVDNAGCLCFYHFGWEILDDLRKAGFRDVGVYLYASVEFGYLGDGLILYAKK